MKQGILLVAFGSGKQEVWHCLRQFEHLVKQRFPQAAVRFALTSGIVRGKLAHAGKKTDSALKALEKMYFEKYTHITVQSLHIIAGKEYTELETQIKDFRQKHPDISLALGRPLIGCFQDIDCVAQAILQSLPQERTKEQDLILMGHGTSHAGDNLYQKLLTALKTYDKNIHLATLDGKLTIYHVCKTLFQKKVNTVWLMPLLALSGKHVQQDLCGSQPDSWVNILKVQGITASYVTTGTAAYPAFINIWLNHLKDAQKKHTE